MQGCLLAPRDSVTDTARRTAWGFPAGPLGRVLAFARLVRDEDIDRWPDAWEAALLDRFPDGWRELAKRAGAGLRAVMCQRS